jgi:hypothetical protein
MIVGDFNLTRRPENRNIARRDLSLMLKFNEAICQLDLMEIPSMVYPLHGRTGKESPFFRDSIGFSSRKNDRFSTPTLAQLCCLGISPTMFHV